MTALSDAPARPATGAGPLHGSRTWIVAGIALVALGAVVVYFYTRSDMWLDEALSVNIARLPLGDLREALKHDGAPPLYYLLLHVWTGVFGSGDVAARSLSGVCMVGTAVATWFAARRVGGAAVAWLALVVTLSNPFAARYATEARMYALEMLIVACGLLAFLRTIERPTWGRAAVFGVLVAVGIYTQYWFFYMLVVVVGGLAWMLWRRRNVVAARRLLIVSAIGVATFIPWLPTFLYQRAHTGTPWGSPVLPAVPLLFTLRDFAGGATASNVDVQEGALLFLGLTVLLLLGIFGRGEDEHRIELDIRTQPPARTVAFLFGAGLVVSLSLNYLAGGAFQSRYSAIVFPAYVILVAVGLTTFRDARVLGAAVAVVVVLGFAGGVRNLDTQRTQAGQVAAQLRASAKPGDAVAYCPDQLAPAVHRLGPKHLDEFVYPSLAGPERVDWVDYKKRLAARSADVATFARNALARAGDRTLWYVSAPGYTTHKGACDALSDAFAAARRRVMRTASDPKIFEKPALEEFPPQTSGS